MDGDVDGVVRSHHRGDRYGQTPREYIWLGDIPLAVVDKVATGSPVIYYVHADHLGRPARMTAQNQAWV